jgi:transcriptional regulator with XRE-family HTH domain
MDGPLKGHWGTRTDDDFLYQVAFDFVAQLEDSMEAKQLRATLAKNLGVSKGRVSQILNDPSRLRLENVVRCARALGLKVSIVAYKDPRKADDDSGPVPPQVFVKCWENANQPTDLFAAGMAVASTTGIETDRKWARIRESHASNDDFEMEIAETVKFGPALRQRPDEDGVERYAGTNPT